VFDDLNNMIEFYERDQSNTPPFGTNSENTLNYKHNFEQKGHELSFDFFYTTSSREGTTDYTQRNYILPDLIYPITSLQQNYSSNSNRNIATQIDYAVPIGTNLKVEAGAKYSSRISDIDNHLDDLIDDDWITNDNSSDQFDYDEQIVAGYITASSKIGKLFSYNIGVRSETTIIDFTSYRVPDSSFKDNYTLFFPSVYLSYEINAAHQFTANFSSRMRRPNYWNLNPRMNYDDPLNLSKGNPHLRPESHYQFEIGYLYNSDYTTFTTTLFHRYSVDGIEMYKEVLNGDTTLRLPHKISKSSRTGIDFIAMQKIFDWWKVDANLSIYNYVVDATNIGGESKTAFNWTTRLNSTMSFNKILDFTLTGGYRSKMLRAQGESNANWNIDASLKYNFSKQLAFSFRVQDIFNTRQWNMYEYIPGVLYNEMKNHFNSRSFFVGVTYKINNYKQKRENENDENNRMNSSEEIEFE
jgi:outer membrane receptor protein involved in Fe transport